MDARKAYELMPVAISDPASLLEDMRLDRDSGDSKRDLGINSKQDERDDWRDRTRKRERGL